ncbi:MAG: GTP-binding protein [Hydrotalea sp.]|nr:GTP-binding protein [Hydrotalea sp.]
MKETLRVITAGSVDDGKSTLIGRLLFDAKVLTRDQLEILHEDGTTGSAGGAPDFAALTDGLIAEKEQGITIDVAYRYFTTETRRYILADCPGHEAYTRNMVTGASTADVAIILLDPTKLDFTKDGDELLLIQTKRHSAVLVMLGVQHIIVAVNKMDAIAFDEQKYQKIAEAYLGFYKKLWRVLRQPKNGNGAEVGVGAVSNPMIIPISAKQGDNIVDKSKNLGWYDGEPLLAYLDKLSVLGGEKLANQIGGILPVQYVLKEGQGVGVKFRGYQGRIEAGHFKTGDQVRVMPAGATIAIKTIYNENGEATDMATAGQTITMQFDGEVEAGRGNYIVKLAVPHGKEDSSAPLPAQATTNLQHSMLCWFDNDALNPNTKYILKHTTRETFVKLSDMELMDLNNIATDRAAVSGAVGDKVVAMNSIFSANIKSQQPIVAASYYGNRNLGSFILIDPVTHHTVAAGVLAE